MKKINLIWIIPVCFALGVIIDNQFFVCHIDTVPFNDNVRNVYDCEEGCINAEWVLYGYQNLTEPILYNQCAQAYRSGDIYFNT